MASELVNCPFCDDPGVKRNGKYGCTTCKVWFDKKEDWQKRAYAHLLPGGQLPGQKIRGWLVQDGELHDYILHNKCHPVNIRLLSSNIEYYRIISSIVDYMHIAMYVEYSDYTTLKGISGANVGIPFNIVIVHLKELDLVMINPEIIRTSNAMRTVESNCGSICLDKPIDVERHSAVTVRYVPFEEFKLDSPSQFSPTERVFRTGTVQHEIDHNNGILITDKE